MKKIKSPARVLLLAIVLLTAIFAAQQTQSSRAESEDINAVEGWQSPTVLSASGKNASFPVLKSDSNGNLVVMYDQDTTGGLRAPFYRRLNQGSSNWTAEQPVASSGSNRLELIAFDFDSANTIHAVWASSTTGQVFYAREEQWPNGGVSLSPLATNATMPAIAVDNSDRVHAVWSQGNPRQIYYSVSTNGGNSWSSPTALTSGGNNADSPAVAVDASNNLHLVWRQATLDITHPDLFRYTIRYLKKDSGGTWSAVSTVSPNNVQSWQPVIITEGDDIHLAFAERISEDEQFPYYRRYIAGSGWQTAVQVGGSVYMNTQDPFILYSTLAACEGEVHLYYHGGAFQNATENVLGTSNQGSGWSAVTTATADLPAGTRALNPAVVCVGSTVHLAYEAIPAGQAHQIEFITRQETVYLPLIMNR